MGPTTKLGFLYAFPESTFFLSLAIKEIKDCPVQIQYVQCHYDIYIG